ncbi:MAG: YidH family protein [Thermodesulfobacteriota bacterium]
MKEPTPSNKPASASNLRDHMANERTFLAWIRTSIGIMAFGFVVEKFSFFMKHLSFFFEKSAPHHVTPSSFSYSSIFGIVLVALGAFMGLLALIRYKKVEREINENSYQPSILIDILVAMGIMIIGIFLIFYMIHTISS